MKCKHCGEVKPVADFKPITIEQYCNVCNRGRLAVYCGWITGENYNENIRQYYCGKGRAEQLEQEDMYEYYLIYGDTNYETQYTNVFILLHTGEKWAMHYINHIHYNSGVSYALLAGCENEDAGTDSGRTETILYKWELHTMFEQKYVDFINANL